MQERLADEEAQLTLCLMRSLLATTGPEDTTRQFLITATTVTPGLPAAAFVSLSSSARVLCTGFEV
jgi:hypothetical protein